MERIPQNGEPSRVSIEFGISLEDIPETTPCFVCDGDADRILIAYEQSYIGKDDKQCIATVQVPGYKCGQCETEMYNSTAIIQVLQAMLSIVAEAGDRETVIDMEDSLNAAIQQRNSFVPTVLY